MAVRFLPVPSEEPAAPRPDRKDLAEVIELRSLLRQRDWKAAAPEDNAAGDEAVSAEGTSVGESPLVSGPWENIVAKAVKPPAPRALPKSVRQTEIAPDVDQYESAAPVPLGDVSEDAVKLLARKAKSSGELREELLRLGHGIDSVDVVIAEFEHSLYLDDAGLARVVTEKLRTSKGASRSQIRVKLKARRLPDAVIEVVLGELDEDEEFALLRSTAVDRARRLSGIDRATAERRLLGFLARRGWSGEPATRAVRDALDGSGGASSGVRFR